MSVVLSYLRENHAGMYDISDINHEKEAQNCMVSNSEGVKGRAVFLAPAKLEIEPLKKLSKQFKEIVLTGINLKTLEFVADSINEKNITFIQCDLSGGLCDEIQKLADELLKNKPKDFSELVTTKFNKFIDAKFNDLIENFQPDVVFLVKKLGHFDYVVSANLGSQIGGNLIACIKEFSDENLFYYWDISKIHTRFLNKGMELHLKVLKALGSGRICFIDTLAFTKYENRTEMATRRFYSALASDFKIVDQKNWDWTLGKVWHVFAFHLEKIPSKAKTHSCDCAIL